MCNGSSDVHQPPTNDATPLSPRRDSGLVALSVFTAPMAANANKAGPFRCFHTRRVIAPVWSGGGQAVRRNVTRSSNVKPPHTP